MAKPNFSFEKRRKEMEKKAKKKRKLDGQNDVPVDDAKSTEATDDEQMSSSARAAGSV